jgi:hypothetical protein
MLDLKLLGRIQPSTDLPCPHQRPSLSRRSKRIEATDGNPNCSMEVAEPLNDFLVAGVLVHPRRSVNGAGNFQKQVLHCEALILARPVSMVTHDCHVAVERLRKGEIMPNPVVRQSLQDVTLPDVRGASLCLAVPQDVHAACPKEIAEVYLAKFLEVDLNGVHRP